MGFVKLKITSTKSRCRCISAANPPTIVHCSAGIGRTGVLILMDTAISYLESKSPIYPLELVQVMRDQRASMVQNSVSIHLVFAFCLALAFIFKSKNMPRSVLNRHACG
jgi:tyrosine-protein phosphatase non-receptor type 4